MPQINNNIEEKRVSFDNAKLLKEKGFDVNIESWWIETLEHTLDLSRSGPEVFEAVKPRILNIQRPWKTCDVVHCSAPTQQVAIDWILINFDTHIELRRDKDDWKCEVYNIKSGNKHVPTGFKNHNTPEDAKDAAINYVLINLI